VDSIRPTLLWVILLAFLWRTARRDRRAWVLLIPAGSLTLVLAILARVLDSYFVFYLHKELSLIITQCLEFIVLGVGILLLTADAMPGSRASVRFLIKLLVLFAAGAVGILTNAWPAVSPGLLTAVFGALLVLILAGHSLLEAGLQRLLRGRFTTVFPAIGIVAVLLPLGILWVLDWKLENPLQSTMETIRILSMFIAVFLGPWLILSVFMIGAARNSFLHDRYGAFFCLK
jgi:hypothetical protein